LRHLLDEARRAGKRQAAPFSKGPPKDNPKKSGRKPGADYGTKAHRQPPATVDETHEASLPAVCPDCGGPVEETHLDQQYQVEIPRQAITRQFNVHLGHCLRCRRRLQGRHALQTSNALGAAAAGLGADAQAAVVELNKNAGLAQGKVARTFTNLFGIPLTRGGVAHIVQRVGRRCQSVYQAIRRAVRRSPWVVPDETGWRVGGHRAWLHGFVGSTSTAYVIDPTRSRDAAEALLGEDYAGIMIHDGWSTYDQFIACRHQQCFAHLLRRCGELIESGSGGAVRFPRQVARLLQQGLALRDRHAAGTVSDCGRAVARGRLQRALAALVQRPKSNEANERLAQHLWVHSDQWFTFLEVNKLDATNWRAEQAMRFGVILRKVWGGNRTWAGAKAQAVLMSVWRTCEQRGQAALDYVSTLLRQQTVPVALPP
jgi:transposase